MTAPHAVLLIGENPDLVDFSAPEIPPGVTAETIWAGITEAQKQFEELGDRVDLCLTDTGETAEAVVAERLAEAKYDCIVIGAGIRALPGNLMLFEKVINAVHRHAPQTPIAFNTRPEDSVGAARRWLPH